MAILRGHKTRRRSYLHPAEFIDQFGFGMRALDELKDDEEKHPLSYPRSPFCVLFNVWDLDDGWMAVARFI